MTGHEATSRIRTRRQKFDRMVPGAEPLEPRQLLTLVIGHRGNSMYAPENTLISLDQAFDRGADVVEQDIQFSADGEIVAMHDVAVDRTTDGTGEVASMMVAQLKALDAGSWFSPAFAGERVPTLAQTLEQARGRGIVYLDLKTHAMAESIRTMLDELAIDGTSIWVSANDEALVQDAHEHLPATPILWYGSVPHRGTPEYFQTMRSMGVAGFDLKWSEFSRSFVRDAQANGMFFSTYTINQPYEWRAALKMRLDAIETDDPGGLAALILSQKSHVTAQLNRGTLAIVGSNRDDTIQIEPGTSSGSVRVVGRLGTIVNGTNESIEFAGVSDIKIMLGNGNDVTDIIDTLLEGGLAVDGGRGNDRISLNASTIHGDAQLMGGAGADWFTSEHSTFGPIWIDGGKGFDTVDMGWLSVPNDKLNEFALPPIYSKLEQITS